MFGKERRIDALVAGFDAPSIEPPSRSLPGNCQGFFLVLTTSSGNEARVV